MSVTVLGRVDSVFGELLMAPVSVAAGFPSPAQDYYDGPVSLDERLVRDKAASFFLRVEWDSMEGVGISRGDVLIADRSVKPAHGDVVVALLDGELTVKRLEVIAGRVALVSAHPAYPPVLLGREADFTVWGTAMVCLHQLGNQRMLRSVPGNLDEYLVRDKAASFFLRVAGESMQGAGISDGDVIITDRSVRPEHGDVVVAVLDGELTLKRLELTPHGVALVAANPAYPPILVGRESDFRVWGTATVCLHQLGNQRVLRAA